MKSDGYIKLHRALLQKAIWQTSTPEQKVILISLLVMANHEKNEWEWKGQKFIIKPGQFITSLKNIKRVAGKGITIKKIRTVLKKFEKYGFLANETTNERANGRLITIMNWNLYQHRTKRANKRAKEKANEGQMKGKWRASNKNVKNDKNKEIYKEKVKIIVSYLNSKTNKQFSPKTENTISFISARLNEGYVIKDFEKVVDNKVSDWLYDKKMVRFLRPETLFSLSHFESYLNENVKGEDDEEIA